MAWLRLYHNTAAKDSQEPHSLVDAFSSELPASPAGECYDRCPF